MARSLWTLPERRALRQRRPARSLAKFHLHCGLASRTHRSPLFDRRTRRCRSLHGLSGAGALVPTAAGRHAHPRQPLHPQNLKASTGLLSARGVGLRYLPPYSPDLNPIELAFAKLKAHLRQAAARTLEELQSAVASSLSFLRLSTARLPSSCPICVYLNRKRSSAVSL